MKTTIRNVARGNPKSSMKEKQNTKDNGIDFLIRLTMIRTRFTLNKTKNTLRVDVHEMDIDPFCAFSLTRLRSLSHCNLPLPQTKII